MNERKKTYDLCVPQDKRVGIYAEIETWVATYI